MGIPVIGCSCSVCQSANPRNKRLRTSALLTIRGKRLLIDAGPDIRQQALKHNIKGIDALLLTHAHYDHTGGLDELRTFFLNRSKVPIPCVLARDTATEVRQRFNYLFTFLEKTKTILTRLECIELEEERGELTVESVPFRYFHYSQADMPVVGYRFGDLAYITDIKEYPDTLFEDLQGVKTLIISALREAPSPLHFTIEDAIAFSRTVQPEHTYIIHIAHEVDHDTQSKQLPPNIHLAYDGLALPFFAGGN